MYVVCVTVSVKPQFVENFKGAILDNARHTRKEPGNVRFDVLQAEEDRFRFFLYEVYHKKEDLARHQQTAHYTRFRDAVIEWQAEPRKGVRYDTVLFYGDEEQNG